MTITDADREAAAEFAETIFCHPDFVARAFARYREAARRKALEEAANVAQGMGTNYDSCAGERYATAIRALIEKEPT